MRPRRGAATAAHGIRGGHNALREPGEQDAAPAQGVVHTLEDVSCPLPRPIPPLGQLNALSLCSAEVPSAAGWISTGSSAGIPGLKRYTILSVVNTSCGQPSHRAAATPWTRSAAEEGLRVTWLPIKLIPSTDAQWWYDPYHRAKSSAKGQKSQSRYQGPEAPELQQE